MSVYFMLMFLWWGLLGYLAVTICFSILLGGIRDSFGETRYHVALILLGILLIRIGNWENNSERRTVERFLKIWHTESNDYPDGEGYMDSMWEHADFIRCQTGDIPNDPGFVAAYRLMSHGDVVKTGNTRMPLNANRFYGDEDAKVARAKMFEATVSLSGVVAVGKRRAKFWVASDNNKIVKFSLGPL